MQFSRSCPQADTTPKSAANSRYPAAYRFLKNYTLTNEDQNPMMKAIDVDGRDLAEVVAEWVEANEARWMPWVVDAMN